MATKVEAWKDSKGNVHSSEQAADLADASAELVLHGAVLGDIASDFGEDGYNSAAVKDVYTWLQKGGADSLRALLAAFDQYSAVQKVMEAEAAPRLKKRRGVRS